MNILKNKKFLTLVLLCALTMLLTACVQTNPHEGQALEQTGQVYGFWNGVADSFLSGFSVLSNIFFGTKYGIYQPYNNGNWYNFGYIGGLGILIQLFFLPFRIAFWLWTGKW